MIDPRELRRFLTAAVVVQRPFDWARDCPDAVGRVFLPVVGTGRGEVLEPYTCIRCGRESWEPFTWAHRPLESGQRTCGGKVVPRSQVDRVRAEEDRKTINGLLAIASAESGFPVGQGYEAGGGGLWAGLGPQV